MSAATAAPGVVLRRCGCVERLLKNKWKRRLLMMVRTFVPGFYVDGFSSAFWGAIVIGVIRWVLSAFFRGSDGRVHVLTHHAQLKRVEGRVVDPDETR